MLLANNHFTAVIGIDIHFTTLPPLNPAPSLYRVGAGSDGLYTLYR